MNISVLQSLIDRTSNQIAEYEGNIQFDKSFRAYNTLEKWELDQSHHSTKYYKSRLPKLREIQKALKKEIKIQLKKSELQRFYDSM